MSAASTGAAAPRFQDRRVLVTGGASGIGLATARLLVEGGARVALLDRPGEALTRAAHELGAFTVAADVVEEVSVERGVVSAAEWLNGLDGLVNAAGIAGGQPLSETDTAQWRRVLDVNLTGAMFVTRAALPFLLQSSPATIVNVASGIALRPFSGQGAYAASKAALLAWTKVLAQELAPRIRVNATCPGSTDTPLMRANVLAGISMEQLTEQYALKRQGTPLEQAQAIAFLTSQDSAFITGVSLAVDGGRTFH